MIPSRPRRCVLAVPGASEKMARIATSQSVDQVMLDLEGATAPPPKVAARARVVESPRSFDISKPLATHTGCAGCNLERRCSECSRCVVDRAAPGAREALVAECAVGKEGWVVLVPVDKQRRAPRSGPRKCPRLTRFALRSLRRRHSAWAEKRDAPGGKRLLALS